MISREQMISVSEWKISTNQRFSVCRRTFPLPRRDGGCIIRRQITFGRWCRGDLHRLQFTGQSNRPTPALPQSSQVIAESCLAKPSGSSPVKIRSTIPSTNAVKRRCDVNDAIGSTSLPCVSITNSNFGLRCNTSGSPFEDKCVHRRSLAFPKHAVPRS